MATSNSKQQIGFGILFLMMSLFAFWGWRSGRIYFINSIVNREENPKGFRNTLVILLIGALLCLLGALGFLPGKAGLALPLR